MREDDAPRSELARRAELALQRSLSELSFAVSQSALPFRDAQLAVGCSGGVRECGGQVAAALDSEELLVSSIEDAPHMRQATLRLLRFAPRAQPRAGAAQLPREPEQELSLTVFALVESLFADRVRPPDPGPVASSAPASRAQAEPSPSRAPPQVAPSAASAEYLSSVARGQQRRRLLAVGWPTLAIGAGLLVGGLVANLAARREGDAYESLDPSRSRAEADAKLAHYRAAEDKMQTARILWGVGGGLTAAGVFVLLWERFAPAADRKLQKSAVRKRGATTAGLSAAASPHGLALAWSTDL